MTVGVAIHWTFRVVVSDIDLFEVANLLTETLLELERSTPGVLDSAVSADRDRGIVEIEVTTSGRSEDDAVATGQSAVKRW